MKRTIAILALSLVTGYFSLGFNQTATAADISVKDVWSRSSAGMTRAGAAFLTIVNKGTADDKLIAASTPAAGKSELHTHLMEDGVMKMRHVPHIPVPAGGMTMLKPGGFHVMLFKLAKPLNEGDSYHLTLEFEKAGKVMVEAHVGKAGAKGMDHGNMDHGKMKMKTE